MRLPRQLALMFSSAQEARVEAITVAHAPGVADARDVEREALAMPSMEHPHGTSLAVPLAAALGAPVTVVMTDNRRTMISMRRVAGRLEVRLHHMFLEASPDVLHAVGRYLRGRSDRHASARIDAFIAANATRIREASPRQRTLRAHGDHHQLAALFDENNLRFFDNVVTASVTWGRFSRGRRRRSIRLGTYLHGEQLITIHPVLDQAWIPRFVVSFVMFHEMLHHVVPLREASGRRCFHTPEFRARERAHPEHDAALAWERANIGRLLRQAAGRTASRR